MSTEDTIEKLIKSVEEKIIKNAHELAYKTVLQVYWTDQDGNKSYENHRLLDSFRNNP